MGNLVDASQFDDVKQLEKTDLVLGGPGGASNLPLQNLANRTRWLKDRIDAVESGGGPFDYDASTSAPPAPGSGSGPAGAIQRKDQFVVTVAGVVSGTPLQVGDSLIAKQDLATLLSHYVIIQGNAGLATEAILGLVKLAQDIATPGADKAISTAGLIALFAQLNSPTFIGNPKAPTKPQTDQSDNIATTSHVAQAVLVETTARTAQDVAIQANVNAEGAARLAADVALQTNIDNEAALRLAGLVGEATVRLNADAAEANNRAVADVALQNNINAVNDETVGWVDVVTYQPNYASNGSYPFQIRKVRGIVQFRGRIDKTVGSINSGDLIFTLPVGYRPVAPRVPRLLCPPSSVVGGVDFIDVNPISGGVFLWEMGKFLGNTLSNSSVHFDNVQFDAAH